MIETTLAHHGIPTPKYTDTIVVVITKESIEPFKQLIQRGANLWPDAPAEIKEFADLITTGKVMQDYKAQEH